MSHVIGKSECPNCAKSGKDRKGDNLANYSDGHSWCFSCGFMVRGDSFHTLRQKYAVVVPLNVSLPEDVDVALTGEGYTWLSKYNLTAHDILYNRILWSESRKLLIFTIFNDDDTLVAWQARNFNKEKPYKYLTKGNTQDNLVVKGESKDSIVLVEDMVSAIKCGYVMASMPILGSVISTRLITRLKGLYKKVYLWLDPDKQREAINFSKKIQLYGLEVATILADKDPKEHSINEIKEILCPDSM